MRFLFSFLLLFALSPGLVAQGILVRSDGGFMTNGAFYGLSTFRGTSGTLRLYGELNSANRKDFRLSSGSDLLMFGWVNDAGNSLHILGSVDWLGNWSFGSNATAVGNFSAASYGSDFNIFSAGNTARLRLAGTALGPGTNVWDVDPAGFTFTHNAGASYNYRFQAGSVIATRFVGSGSNLTDIAVSSLGFEPATNTFAGIVTPLGYTPLTNSADAITNALGYQPATNTVTYLTNAIGVYVDGGGASAAVGGVGGNPTVPYDATIIGFRLTASENTTAVFDVWKTNWNTFTNSGITVGHSITAAAKPTLTAVRGSEDLALSGWGTTVKAGDVFGFHLDSNNTASNLLLQVFLRHQ